MQEVTKLFLWVVQKSLTASYVILVVLLVRLLLKRAPRIFSYVLWAVVWFRLLCPVSLESAFGLLPFPFEGAAGGTQTELFSDKAQPGGIRQWLNAVASFQKKTDSGQELILDSNREQLPELITGAEVGGASFLSSPMFLMFWLRLAAGVWIAGVILLIAFQLARWFYFKQKLSLAVREKESSVFVLENVETAFVWGLLRPGIYLPAGLGEKERSYILRHEEIHVRRKDYLIQTIAWLTVCLYWFHPLVWLSFRLMNTDMELSCDEAVLREMGNGIKKSYAASLLAMASVGSEQNRDCFYKNCFYGRSPHFGDGEVKERVIHVLHYKKATGFRIVAACLVVFVIGVGLAFNHTSGRAEESENTAVTFPAYQGGKNEYNHSIYETAPFTLTMDLPEGWYMAEPSEGEQEPTTPWTPVRILDAEGKQVGFVGFGLFEDMEGAEEMPQEEYYKIAFSEIRLGSMMSWCNDYMPVRTDERGESAVCQIYQSENGSTIESPAVVAYDRLLGVYIAMSLEPDCVTEEELENIAGSIQIELVPVS